MKTEYYVYEMTHSVKVFAVMSFLAMIVTAVLAFGGFAEPKLAFGVYLVIDLIGSAYLSGHREIANHVETH